MTALEVLRMGRERIATSWGQGWGLRIDGPYCALTATTVTGEDDDDDAEDYADRLIAQVLAQMCNVPRVDVARWNDEPERTREDVLALYDAAIARLERQG